MDNVPPTAQPVDEGALFKKRMQGGKMTKGRRGRLCGSAGGEMVMKMMLVVRPAVLEGGGWKCPLPSPSSHWRRNGAALFGGGVALSTYRADKGQAIFESEMPEGSPQQPSMLARYLHTARGIEHCSWVVDFVEGFFFRGGRYMTHRGVSFRLGTCLLKYLFGEMQQTALTDSSSVSRSWMEEEILVWKVSPACAMASWGPGLSNRKVT